jgi:hypothetical protein
MSSLTNLNAAARRNGLRDQTAGSSTTAMIARPNTITVEVPATMPTSTVLLLPTARTTETADSPAPCREQLTKSVDDSQRGNSECAGGSTDGTTPNTATTVMARIQPGRSRSF